MTPAERTLEVAAEVARVLVDSGYGAAVIGAVALAARGYPRATLDVDIATLVHPQTLRALASLAETLRARGYEVDIVEPDIDDPLGGVINVQADGANLVQVVNYYNPWNGWAIVAKRALETAEPNVLGALSVVDVPHLVALKLYSGVSRKTADDVQELMVRNPQAAEEVRRVCRELKMEAELDEALRRR